ncbi:hypothetical protein NUM3379_10210 [Kineococcus sp. NUM-3379]
MAERGTWADRRPAVGLDTPQEARRPWFSRPSVDPETFGRVSEKFARFMGTARFLVYMTAFVLAYVAWNSLAPERMRFDPYSFTFLTLVLSLQASYAAPLILLAQNRQTDRDRVISEQDRARDERGLADTEYLTREVAALRIALRDVATRDFVRAELRAVLEELRDDEDSPTTKRKGKGKGGQGKGGADRPGPDRTAPGRTSLVKGEPVKDGPVEDGPDGGGAQKAERPRKGRAGEGAGTTGDGA